MKCLAPSVPDRRVRLLPGLLLLPLLAWSIGCDGRIGDASAVPPSGPAGSGDQGIGIGTGPGSGTGTGSGGPPTTSGPTGGGGAGTASMAAGTGGAGPGGPGPGTPVSGDAGTSGSAPSSPGTGTGLPCDVQTLLVNRCQSCHGAVPVGGAPSTFVTYQDLTGPSKSEPSQSEAEVAVARMQNPVLPMPPKPGTPATAAEVGTLQAWIAAGYPTGSCGGGPVDGGADGGVTDAGGGGGGGAGGAGAVVGSNPFAATPVCTSKTMTRGGEGPTMDPGMACISCHSRGEGPRLAIAGTVYPTAHEPDQCNGANGNTGIQVVITGADGKSITLTPNAVGNFSSGGAVATPYQAKLVYMGRERLMVAAQTSGDCNSCHTQAGASAAPGRLLIP